MKLISDWSSSGAGPSAAIQCLLAPIPIWVAGNGASMIMCSVGALTLLVQSSAIPLHGKLLRTPFDANAGPNEAHLSSGDSGGGVFVLNPSTNRWEFAGVNLSVDGPFSFSMDGSNPFNAAMFDTIGLFVQSDQGWITAPNPSAFTRLKLLPAEASSSQ